MCMFVRLPELRVMRPQVTGIWSALHGTYKDDSAHAPGDAHDNQARHTSGCRADVRRISQPRQRPARLSGVWVFVQTAQAS